MLLQHVLHGNMKHVDHSKRCCDDEHLLRKREWRDLRALLVSFASGVSNMSLVSWKNERGWQVQGNYRLTINFFVCVAYQISVADGHTASNAPDLF